jgi:hypothetical protein
MAFGDRVTATRKGIWALLVACLSFCLYRLTRLTFQCAREVSYLLSRRPPAEWRTLAPGLLGRPLYVLALLTAGPRWNPHAFIAVLGPVFVRRTLRIDVGALARSAGMWTIALHQCPGFRPVATSGAATEQGAYSEVLFRVTPGRYFIGVRYYEWSGTVELPRVDVDGRVLLRGRPSPGDHAGFYARLGETKRWFHYWLFYYVRVLLRFRHWLPRSFVESELLPLPNKETRYYYGLLGRRERLSITLNPCLFKDFAAFFTLYNGASFPVLWYQVVDERHLTPQSTCDGFFLIRIQARADSPQSVPNDWVRLAIA